MLIIWGGKSGTRTKRTTSWRAPAEVVPSNCRYLALEKKAGRKKLCQQQSVKRHGWLCWIRRAGLELQDLGVRLDAASIHEVEAILSMVWEAMFDTAHFITYRGGGAAAHAEEGLGSQEREGWHGCGRYLAALERNAATSAIDMRALYGFVELRKAQKGSWWLGSNCKLAIQVAHNLQGNHFENGAALIPSAEKQEQEIHQLRRDNLVSGTYRQRARIKEPLLVALFWIFFSCFLGVSLSYMSGHWGAEAHRFPSY